MRLLLTRHHILPGVYHRLPKGEKEIIRAILELEAENRRNEARR